MKVQSKIGLFCALRFYGVSSETPLATVLLMCIQAEVFE